MKVPSKYKGKQIACKVIMSASSGDWKSDWYFEGVSFTVNCKTFESHLAVQARKIKSTVVDFDSDACPLYREK